MPMTHHTLLTGLWDSTLAQSGGAEQLAASARATRAFLRPREVKSAADLLRLILAHCLGGRSASWMRRCVPKFGRDARAGNDLWRLHCAFDLPSERLSFCELTDEKGKTADVLDLAVAIARKKAPAFTRQCRGGGSGRG